MENVGFAEEIPRHARDQQCFDFIEENITTCIKEHRCGIDGPLPLLPDRIIWIKANNESHIQLIEPKDIRAPFIALSYCWGPISPNIYLTNTSNLNTRKAGIEFNDLPPLFQDIVDIARALRIEYIWIDRLCIIQGDDGDFGSQAPKMGEIYGNATLTISAASATTENDRILVPRDDKWLANTAKLNIKGIGSRELRFRRRSYPLGTENLGGDYGKVSTRAWIWQERLLARRTVFFTPAALKFECRHHSIWEGFNKSYAGYSWSARLNNVTHLAWTALVEEFMKRDITRPSDRLPAMDAVMKRIEKSTEGSPFWGLWSNTLIESLSWRAHRDRQPNKVHNECWMNPGFYAPTWSWASVDGPISYATIKSLDSSPIQWDLECRSLNEASGLISVVGHIVFLQLHVTIERRQQYDQTIMEDKFMYEYRVMGLHKEKGILIKPDVPLKPWSGNIDSQYVSTVIRVPYGESPPEQSWTSRCACLLIGKGEKRRVVLFLGRSLRVPGAWERIGMDDGHFSTRFSESQRSTIHIA